MKEWIVGRNPVLETLKARRRQLFRLWVARGVEEKGRMLEIIEKAGERRVKAEWVLRSQLDGLNPTHQGVALEVSGYPYSTLQDIQALAKHRNEPPFILVLDVIQNPQNLGTLLRTAEAVGVHGILIPLARAAGVTPAVVDASAGASEHVHIAQVNLAQALDTLRKDGIWIYGLEGSPDAQPIAKTRLDGPVALVVGGEGDGMRALVRKSCDQLIRLEMHGKIESYNAAVAGSIALYQALQARLKVSID